MPEGGAPSFAVEVTDEAYLDLLALPSDGLLERMGRFLKLLATTPFLGRVYDPAYEAKQPPVKCRVLFCGNYGIYYEVNENALTVTILAIEDQRRDPLNRFSRYDYAIEAVSE